MMILVKNFLLILFDFIISFISDLYFQIIEISIHQLANALGFSKEVKNF